MTCQKGSEQFPLTIQLGNLIFFLLVVGEADAGIVMIQAISPFYYFPSLNKSQLLFPQKMKKERNLLRQALSPTSGFK